MMRTIKGSAALGLMQDVQDVLQDKFGHIELDDACSIMSGGTRYFGYGRPLFYMGTQEFATHPDTEFPVDQALVPVVGLFHEVCGHGSQICCEFQKSTPLSRVLALNYYACYGSDAYYGWSENGPTDAYYRQPYEIAAQYMGIKCAYSYLSGRYGEANANDMMCSYVNYRIANDSEFVGSKREYKRVEDVLSDFDTMFQKRVFEHRYYNSRVNQGDELFRYAKKVGSAKFLSRVAGCQDGLKQDLMMTSVYIALNDDDHKIKTLPAFRDVDLSVGHAFFIGTAPMRPKPKRRDLSLGALDVAFRAPVMDWKSMQPATPSSTPVFESNFDLDGPGPSGLDFSG